MAFFWRLFDVSGGASGDSREFDDRDAAEAWLAGAWQDLVSSGAVEVALQDGDAEIYRMSLLEE